MRMTKTIAAAITASMLLVGCGVPKKDHEALQSELEKTKVELADTQQAKAEAEEAFKADIAKLEKRIADLEGQIATLQSDLDEANAELSMYESKTGGLQDALKATKADLDELKRQRAEAQQRLRKYRELAKRLASMVESGQLSVKVRNGKMVIELANNILFDPGKTELKDDGQGALTQLAGVLQTIKDRSFLVTGHTDNVPISSSQFKSNWELSTARAVNVVQYLQDAGVNPKVLAAAGYGEYDPVASNETDEGKALNRRIEIILMPNLDELPALPKNLFETDS